MSTRNKIKGSTACCLCGLSEKDELQYGKIYEHSGIVIHYYCLLLSSNMEQKGNDDEGILGFLAEDIQKEIRRGKKLVCSYCKRNGATLGCCNTKCKKIFHFPCGLQAGSLSQFFGEFRSYCQNHRPKQEIDDHVKEEVSKSSETLCYICYDKVNHQDFINTLWAPCCKKNAWFHKKCVQQLAQSAGYFFKCPLCNNKSEFQKEMLEYGIFIPSQDASWELVPNAFQELLYRHDQCDAVVCLCPKGRKYTSSNAKWELALCRTCGSQGIHMACGQLKWANPIWDCSECVSIMRKSESSPISGMVTRIRMRKENESDSEDSDTDISVGNDAPVQLTPFNRDLSPIPSLPPKIRPGPRSYKLKQQYKTRHMQKSTSSSVAKKVGVTQECKVADKMSNKEKYFANEHCGSHLNITNHDVIMLDSDDDVIEIINHKPAGNQLESISLTECDSLISDTEDTEAESRALIIQSPSLLMDEPLGEADSSDNNHLNAKNLSTARGVVTENTRVDSVMNIKITNITSLPLETFTSESRFDSIEQDATSWLKEKHIESPSKQSSPSSSIIKSSLKRKSDSGDISDHTELSLINIMEERLKKSREQDSGIDTSSDGFGSKVCGYSSNSSESKTISSLPKKSHATSDLQDDEIITVSSEVGNRSVFRSFYFSDANGSMRKDATRKSILRSSIDNNSIVLNTPRVGAVNFVHNQFGDTRRGSIEETEIKRNTLTQTHNNLAVKLSANAGQCVVSDSVISRGTNNKTAILTESQDNGALLSAFLNDDMEHRACNAVEIDSRIGDDQLPNNILAVTNDCDGDAGTNAVFEADSQSSVSELYECDQTGESRTHSSDTLAGKSSRGTTATGTAPPSPQHPTVDIHNFSHIANNLGTCDQPRLIPEYMHVRDLKFRVSNPNKLQMILYNTFSVNVNMNTGLKEKTDSCASMQESGPILPCHSICETSNGTIQQEDSTSNERNEMQDLTNTHDDTKENLDPIPTICYTNASVNSITMSAIDRKLKVTSEHICNKDSNYASQCHNADSSKLICTVCSGDLHRAAEGNITYPRNICGQNSQESLLRCMSKIEENGDIMHTEANSLSGNVENLTYINETNDGSARLNRGDTSANTVKDYQGKDDSSDLYLHVPSCAKMDLRNRHLRKVEQVKHKNRNLLYMSDNSFHKMDAWKDRGMQRLRQLVQRTLFSKDAANRARRQRLNNNIREPFKVSIDLNKIQDLMVHQPDLFFKYKAEEVTPIYSKRLEKKNIENTLMANGRKHIDVSSSSRSATHCKSSANTRVDKIIAMLGVKEEQRSVSFSKSDASLDNQKRSKRTASGHLESRYNVDR
ncbi:hypothetical protein KM043_009524 [Ampulex compressa]|nr:hypothetical protein KM043_009524 [Ampulex compressa]